MKQLTALFLALTAFVTTASADLLPIPRTPKQPKVVTPSETSAQQTDPSKKDLLGAVPEKDGIVTFTQSFRVQGKSQAEIYPVIANYVKSLVAAGRQDLRTRLVSEDADKGEVVAKVEEIMTFKKKFLNWDHTYFRYLISAECSQDSRVTLTITQISYYYQFDQEGNNGETYRAEEWITDKEAVNKKGTKLYPRSGKFRRKTIDRVEEIFKGAQAAFDEEEEVVVRRRKSATTVVE